MERERETCRVERDPMDRESFDLVVIELGVYGLLSDSMHPDIVMPVSFSRKFEYGTF